MADTTPPTEAKRRKISVRITIRGADYIANEARRADITASHMARRMFHYAMINMPRGWVPPATAPR